VILRKAYGAGLYAMSGPAFEPDTTLALPSAKIAVMGPEAAVNAVFARKLEGLSGQDAARRRAELEAEYSEDVDIYKLASELIVDHVVEPEQLRGELVKRFELYATRFRVRSERKHGVYPV
jgi:acetyl-CoA carboxylase carboxyltransferase component